MTDNSPYYTTFISKTELATLRKSHAALRGWCGRYRGEIERLEAGLRHVQRHFGSAAQSREIAHWALHPECKETYPCKHYWERDSGN